MDRDETRKALVVRRNLTGDGFDDTTVDAWAALLHDDVLADVLAAMTKARRDGRRHVTIGDLIEFLPVRPTSTRAHPITCECGGEGLLSEEVTDPRGTYRVWRPCPGTGKRVVPNPGPEMSLAEYEALHRPPPEPDARDHEWARTTARAMITDPDAVPLSATNPLRPLVERYLLQMQQHPHVRHQRGQQTE
jgi:hypothetical protein